jgi:glycerol-3-phosphate acyltransferase PlsY
MRRCDPIVLGRRGDLHTKTRRGPTRRGALPVLAASFACGAIPFAQLAARIVTGTDLRRYGAGTVSGTALYEVAGFGPLAIAGCLEVAKGGVGPWSAGRSRPILGALAAAAGVTGHNWSPLLGGKGGRGISPSLGATLVMAPEGAAVLVTGLGAGRTTCATVRRRQVRARRQDAPAR